MRFVVKSWLGMTFCFCLALAVQAGMPDTAVFRNIEQRLILLRSEVIASDNDAERLASNERFIRCLDSAIYREGFYQYPFNRVKSFGVIPSPDHAFRIITWNLPYDDGTHFYYCYLQYKNRKTNEILLFRLIDHSADIDAPEKRILDETNWYGALYYKIIPFKRKGKQYYILFGWDGNTEETTKKVIEVLHFTEEGKPVFGAPLFHMEKKVQKRILFEYSSQAVMTIRYEEKDKRIVFDHLSPSKSTYKGKFEYYGPDLSYDALQLKKGKWFYLPDVDVRNPG